MSVGPSVGYPFFFESQKQTKMSWKSWKTHGTTHRCTQGYLFLEPSFTPVYLRNQIVTRLDIAARARGSEDGNSPRFPYDTTNDGAHVSRRRVKLFRFRVGWGYSDQKPGFSKNFLNIFFSEKIIWIF